MNNLAPMKNCPRANMQGNLNMMPGHCVILTLFAFGKPFYKLFCKTVKTELKCISSGPTPFDLQQ